MQMEIRSREITIYCFGEINNELFFKNDARNITF